METARMVVTLTVWVLKDCQFQIAVCGGDVRSRSVDNLAK